MVEEVSKLSNVKRLFNVVTALSVLLFIATATLFVMSLAGQQFMRFTRKSHLVIFQNVSDYFEVLLINDWPTGESPSFGSYRTLLAAGQKTEPWPCPLGEFKIVWGWSKFHGPINFKQAEMLGPGEAWKEKVVSPYRPGVGVRIEWELLIVPPAVLPYIWVLLRAGRYSHKRKRGAFPTR